MPSQDNGRIRFMTLNLRFGRAQDGPNAWSHRLQAYAPLFEAFPSEVYCFQEANDFQITALNAWLPGHRSIGIRRPAPPFWQHDPIFYPETWHLVAWERIYLSPTPLVPSRQRSSKWPRQCTIGHFRHGSRDILCVNTHLDFAPETQRESARIIAGRLCHYPAAAPCIVAGDFNAGPGGGCHRLMTGHGWVPGRRFRSVFGETPPGSFHGFSGNIKGRHIDWILYDGPLRVIAAQAVTRSFSGVFPSDHYPMTSTLAYADDR